MCLICSFCAFFSMIDAFVLVLGDLHLYLTVGGERKRSV